jgi:hypothetical protein
MENQVDRLFKRPELGAGAHRLQRPAKVEPLVPRPFQAFIKHSITAFGDNSPPRYQNGDGQSIKNDGFRDILKGIDEGG